MDPGSINTWLDKYAKMMQLAHDAIEAQHTTPVMMYASVDQARPLCGLCYLAHSQPCHVLLTGLPTCSPNRKITSAMAGSYVQDSIPCPCWSDPEQIHCTA